MINPEDDPPVGARKLFIPPALDLLGVDELIGYVSALEGEISRVKSVISAKQAHKAAAAALFRAGGQGGAS